MVGTVIALVGPTGSGKSAAAMAAALSAKRPVEIVAVDAFTVYRGMDVGTATPSAADRAQVNHHMVDVLDPEEDCSVRWFQQRARAAIRDVVARGALPLLVGGSGLYYRAVVDGLEFPPTDPAVRAQIEDQWAADPVAAHRHLADRDAPAAERIDPLNLRRTVRALEVMQITGRPFSSFHTAWTTHDSVFPNLQVVGVEIDRPALVVRLAQRVQSMLAQGWVDEARALQGRTLSDTAGQAIGYAELLAHLDDALTWGDMVERITIRTRRFAVRQQRWFGKDPRVTWTAEEDLAGVLGGLIDPPADG